MQIVRSTAPEAGARCLRRRLFDIKRILKIKALVGAARFELTTPCAQGIGTYKYGNSISFMYSMGWFHILYSQDRAM